MKTIYLAGPIAGKNYKEATEWRNYAADQLNRYGVSARSPMRGKEHLASVEKFTNQGYEENPLSSQSGIVTRDRFDVRTADVVLMNLVGANTSSLGTAVELGWADAWRIPVVAILDINNSANPMCHAFVKELASIIVPTLDDGIAVCLSLLGVDRAAPMVLVAETDGQMVWEKVKNHEHPH